MVRVPFAEIIEPFVFVFGFFKKSAERAKDLADNPHESRESALFALYGYLLQAESIGSNVLSHEDAPDLPPAGLAQNLNQLPDYFRGYYQLHHLAFQANR